MVNVGVGVVILSGHQVLLTKREDFEVWCLPGGSIDPGEAVSDAAIREACEETGLVVGLTHLIGIYSRSHWSKHTIVFAAQPTGGSVRPQAGEVIEVRFFDTDVLPTDLVWWHRQPIRDAITGVGGSAVWAQDAPVPVGLDPHDRHALYALRDQADLSRSEFYNQYLGQSGSDGERRTL